MLAVLRFVLGRELGFVFRMMNEALRIGKVVFFAPIAFGFEIGDELEIAAGADFFGDAVLVAPPGTVGMGIVGDVLGGRRGAGCWIAASGSEGDGDDEAEGGF